MQAEVVLTFRDEGGEWHEVEVASRRFTIGSGGGNDLRVEAPGVERRHAVIETYEGGAFVYDCQTERGTLLNNAPLRGSAPLRGGDLLTLGDSYDITVKLRAQPSPQTQTSRQTDAPSRSQTRPRPVGRETHAQARTTRSDGESQTPSLKHAAVAAAVLIAVVAGLFVFAGRRPARVGVAARNERRVEPRPAEPDSKKPDDGGAAPARGGDADAPGDAELDRAAVRVVRLVSGDERSYPFPPEALRDISRQVEQYRQSGAMRDAFASVRRDAQQLSAQARAASVPPEMAVYAAIAESNGGRDPAAAARRMIPQLSELRVTFGGGDANGSLLVIAAYTYGVGSKKSHPLLATLRGHVQNSFGERNVWDLRARGGLSDAAYNFVIRTLAVGVIAQDPRRYGIQSGPLVY